VVGILASLLLASLELLRLGASKGAGCTVGRVGAARRGGVGFFWISPTNCSRRFAAGLVGVEPSDGVGATAPTTASDGLKPGGASTSPAAGDRWCGVDSEEGGGLPPGCNGLLGEAGANTTTCGGCAAVGTLD
jgi:hypothetical protein